MPKFNWTKNQVTGQPEAKVTMTLKSLPSTELQNVNGKSFYPITIEFEDVNDIPQTVSAIIYQGNLDRANETGGLRIDNKYAGRVQIGLDGRYYLQMSHLSPGDWATAEMFKYDGEISANPKEKMAVGEVF